MNAPTAPTEFSLGLTLEALDLRKGSTGASATRLIVNSDDDDVYKLWMIERGEIDPPDLSDNVHAQAGHHMENFVRDWFERRTGLVIGAVQEHVTAAPYPGFHATLDGLIAELHPSQYANRPDLAFTWGCPQPPEAVQAVVEIKYLVEAGRFDLDAVVAKYQPQLHQAMALTGASYAVLIVMTSTHKLFAHVVRFDPFYWAECMTRVQAFRDAVRDGTPPLKFGKLSAAASGVQPVQMKTLDMTKGRHANMWRAFAVPLLENWPTDDDKERARQLDKAKEQLKKLLDKDVGEAFGAGIRAKRNKAGSISFEVDEAALEAVRNEAAARAEAGIE